jgi:hypothetical protein
MLDAPRELMRMHIEALYTRDAAGDLVSVNEPAGGGPAPRFFLGATDDGCMLRFRHDVNVELRTELTAAARAERGGLTTPPAAVIYEEIIRRSTPALKTSTGPAFTFPARLPPARGTTLIDASTAHLLEPLLSAWIPDVPMCQPMIVIVVDGKAVSICASVRITERAHEAGVDTALLYRGRGYAGQVVTAWANAVRGLDRVPLYSTSWTNTASRSIARKLALVHFGNDLHIT